MTDRGGADEYNARVIEEFQASGGRLGGAWAGTPLGD